MTDQIENDSFDLVSPRVGNVPQDVVGQTVKINSSKDEMVIHVNVDTALIIQFEQDGLPALHAFYSKSVAQLIWAAA